MFLVDAAERSNPQAVFTQRHHLHLNFGIFHVDWYLFRESGQNQPVPSFIVLSLHLLFSFLFLVWTSMLPCTSMMHFVYIISFSSNCFSGSWDVNLVSISFHKRVTIVFKSPRRLSSTSSLVYFVSFQRKCCRKKLPGIFFKIKRSFCYRPVGLFFLRRGARSNKDQTCARGTSL